METTKTTKDLETRDTEAEKYDFDLPETPEEQKYTREKFEELLSDRWWRLNNLYYIKDEDGNKILFKPENREAQVILHENLWFYNIVPKARQLGVCLDPETKVLTADLRWIKIGEMEPGMEIISVDEETRSRGKSKRMKKGVVEGVIRHIRDTYKITFEDGSTVTCTGEHPWLSRKTNSQWDWRAIKDPEGGKKKLTVGTKIRRILDYNDFRDKEPDPDDGWIAGMLDGEGSISNGNRAGCQISVSQVDGPVWDRLVAYFERNNYTYRNERDEGERPSKYGSKPVNKLVITKMDEIFRLLSTTRPTRFINEDWWQDREMPTMSRNCDKKPYRVIKKIEHLGDNEVVDLQTSEGTYIAEGLVSHNTTFFTILYLDQILFSKNKSAGIIAHRMDDAKKIFSNKIKFAWDNLHPWVKENMDTVKETASYIEFDNGSSIFVDLSTRSGTVQLLHISEFSYVCQKHPDKAEEIVTGALNSVHSGNMVSIESTARGTDGYFHKFCMEADEMAKSGQKLTEFDFRLFFFPWYMDMKYSIDTDTQVVIPKEMDEYFAKVEAENDITLTEGQKKWYVKKHARMGHKMKEEFPSTLEECFEANTEGSYYGQHMTKMYEEDRITMVPYETGLKVDTYWDIGMNDFTVILLVQQKGPQIRIIDMYWNSGEGMAHYVDWLDEQRREKGYRYGRHYLPHDAAKRSVEGRTTAKILADEGLRPQKVCERTGVQDGINRVRAIFNRFLIDKKNCQRLIKALKQYRKEWNEKRGVFKDKPLHDEESHFVDPIRLMAMEYREDTNTNWSLDNDGSLGDNKGGGFFS